MPKRIKKFPPHVLIFATDVQFRSAQHLPAPDRRSDASLVLTFEEDAGKGMRNLSLLPPDALRLVEGVVTALREAKHPKLERVVRDLAARGAAGDLAISTEHAPNGSAPKASRSSKRKSKVPPMSIVATNKIFLLATSGTQPDPPHKLYVVVALEGADAKVEHIALEPHDALFLAESVTAVLCERGMAQARTAAKQLREAPDTPPPPSK